jgi:hypothetical protein
MAGTTKVSTKVTVRHQAVAELARGPELRRHLEQAVTDMALDMQAHAPVRSGAGRRSIKGEVVMTSEGWVGTASWDVAHYYLSFQDKRKQFAEPAIQRVRYV